MTKITAEEIIQLLDLEPLPVEGGMFRQNYRSKDILAPTDLPRRYTSPKPAGTAIYYLLTNDSDSFSALHKLPTDEVYHFYLGDPVALSFLLPSGEVQQVILGQDLIAGQYVQHVAPADVWHGSRLVPGGEFALMGTTMAPGYTDEDFIPASREELLAQFPQNTGIIHELTRSKHD